MKSKMLIGGVLIAAAVLARAGIIDTQLPQPWIQSGEVEASAGCTSGVDTELEIAGEPNLTVKCSQPHSGHFSVMQPTFSAGDYRGMRVRFSALIKAEDVGENGGGLFMVVQKSYNRTDAYDDMSNRMIAGTTGWVRHSVVLDVSEAAQKITLGMSLQDRGQLWMKDIAIEQVGLDVPVTDLVTSRRAPVNLELSR